MSTQTMYNFLSNVIANCTTPILIIHPQSIQIGGDIDVIINKGYGLTEERIILSTTPKYSIILQWNKGGLSEEDHSILFQQYFNSSYGCGMGRTFYWQAPSQYDNHIYTVRFNTLWQSFLQNYKNFGIGNLGLVVLGRKAV